MHSGINHILSKTAPPSFLPSSPLNLQIVQALPFLGNPPFRLVCEPQKYQSFSLLTPSYLLKVTKFLVKISQFEFSVMIEKNIFLYQLFLSLNISGFSLFFYVKIEPPPPTPLPTP